MNTHSLSKLYDQLTARERLPLMIAAGARGDRADQERLITAAGRERLSVPDHFGLAQALNQVTDFHMHVVMDLVANFWQWWGLWMIYGLQGDTKARTKNDRRGKFEAQQAKEVRAGGIASYFATRLVNHLDGWKSFCAGLSIDPADLTRLLVGCETLQRAENHARELADGRRHGLGQDPGRSSARRCRGGCRPAAVG